MIGRNMNGPCSKDCPRRTIHPNCHGRCQEYLDFLESVRVEREAQQADVRATLDITAERRHYIKRAAKVKRRAKGERR